MLCLLLGFSGEARRALLPPAIVAATAAATEAAAGASGDSAAAAVRAAEAALMKSLDLLSGLDAGVAGSSGMEAAVASVRGRALSSLAALHHRKGNPSCSSGHSDEP